MEPQLPLSLENLFPVNGQKKEKVGVVKRSILVRGLPGSLSVEQSKDALRQLFSGAEKPSHLQVNGNDGQRRQWTTGQVPAKSGALAQSSWRANCLNPKEGPGNAAQRKIPLSNQHRKQLQQQLPYAVSSIRVASDERGSSIYAVVDFTHESLANLALQLVGEAAILPKTSTQVRLSLHETWSTPLAVDQYHVYVSGLPPGATAAQVEDIVTSATGIAPTHAKVASVAGLPSRRGVQEYAFLRYEDEEIAEEALKKLTNFGFVRLASHESALAAISHLHGMQLRGRALACAWSNRTPSFNDEEQPDDSWEREEECMDYVPEPVQPSDMNTGPAAPAMSPRASAKRSAAETAGAVFWLSILAESGPVSIHELCSKMKRRHRQLQHWLEQEWEEDASPSQPPGAQVSESKAQ
ncbi:RNA recognition motif domain-containing protein, putative [Eimeria brunetti]|uniref:RNA recognition motif domain-containing protein, putative n=1 Tax=Eimeria brunetti TaxID=51314 RepID=U6LSL4_9EIME|nr:RNA recognition motif domain-containing protein, putative [Eimeria brunetti]